MLNHPASRGAVRLASADPRAAPLVDPRYLTDERDVAALAHGVARAEALLDAAVAADGGGGGGGAAADRGGFGGAPPAVADACRRRATTLWHFCGTARMGADAASVCDERLRVRGVTRLRVADASVMPLAPGGNTMATTMAIGARCASFILEDAGLAR